MEPLNNRSSTPQISSTRNTIPAGRRTTSRGPGRGGLPRDVEETPDPARVEERHAGEIDRDPRGLHRDNLRQRQAQLGLVRNVDLTDERNRDLVARPVHGPLHEFRTPAHELDLSAVCLPWSS